MFQPGEGPSNPTRAFSVIVKTDGSFAALPTNCERLQLLSGEGTKSTELAFLISNIDTWNTALPLLGSPDHLWISHIQFLKLSLKSPLLSNILCYGEMLLKYGNYVFSIMPRHSFKRVHQSHFQPFVFLSVALQ